MKGGNQLYEKNAIYNRLKITPMEIIYFIY